jgi:protoheme IX farnesyltransferase
MKPRVMSLVIFTCAVGLLTSNSNINISDAMIGIILVALGAGAAGCLNMWYESDLDALMTRTCLRPIPSGKINKEQALIFGILLTVFSVGALNYFTNFLSASLLLFTIFFLSFCLHNMVKKKNTAKYCNWRYCRFLATSNRLGDSN